MTPMQHHLVQAKQHRPAVDAPGERNANRLLEIVRGEPELDFMVERLDIALPDNIEVRRQRAALRIEEPTMDRVGVRTADQPQRCYVMSGHHSRVGRMELAGPTVLRQL